MYMHYVWKIAYTRKKLAVMLVQSLDVICSLVLGYGMAYNATQTLLSETQCMKNHVFMIAYMYAKAGCDACPFIRRMFTSAWVLIPKP
jgi:hypothetical protein